MSPTERERERVRQLLDDLFNRGWSLSADARQRLVDAPPADPHDFAVAVMAGEGREPALTSDFRRMREYVRRRMQGWETDRLLDQAPRGEVEPRKWRR